ncbi:hypothetical protein BEWA_011280 [Theileria equi strain WA]|uniref:Uncharacterized protein n=1 Tax=Theileria equi strain WA TaxID=1537102 RepID=L0B1K2_THEEQ|nr:hypothetical protein BEWA_011280 [Theileria equi strain WA]AFZ81710.1 hypothetical protein BEWA_011280 [Theileria equi strain WA]|eukprot:XP_004831376.1 hypothetical protein BEWA_011280 [Theileria equi strain WA]
MRNRNYNINIFNETTFTLHRSYQRLKHGKWLTWLPEKISPGTNVTIQFSSNHSIHSYSLYLSYGVVLGNVKYILEIKSSKTSNGYKFVSEFNPCEKPEYEKNDNPLTYSDYTTSNNSICKVYKEILEVSKSSPIDQTTVCTYIVRIQESKEGAKIINDCRDRLRNIVLKNGNPFDGKEIITNYSQYIGDQPYDSSLDFSWEYRTSDWIDILRKSHRSILIRIVNLTSKHMKLILPSNDFTNNPLTGEGIWVEYPNEEIPSLCGTSFGCKCNGFFGEISGKCTYTVLGESGTFEFSWEQSSVGSLHLNAAHSSNSYTIVKHVESLNEAVAMIHIMDLSHPPLKILVARALSPVYVKHIDIKALPRDRMGEVIFDLKSSKKNISTDSHSDETKNLVITDFLVKYYINSLDPDNRKENYDFLIKSPRTFFDHIHSKNTNSPINKITSDYFIYLEWIIGHERFYKVYNPNEKMCLDSSMVGGIPDKQVIMNSHLINITFNEAEILTKVKQIESKGILNHNPLINLSNTSLITNEFGGSNSPKVRPFLRNLSQSELLEVVLMIFNSFCDGFQPFIEKKMVKKFGVDWLKICKIPHGHIWRNDDSVRIDIEGLIYIVTAYWMELFDEIFGESTILHTIQVILQFNNNTHLDCCNLLG